jgi:adenylate cyclase class 2
MKTEIETRFLDIDRDQLTKKLRSLNAVDHGEVRLEETIFEAADGSWVGKHKFIRLRKIGDRTVLTYKENAGQTISSAQEIEFEVSDFTQCSELLGKTGLKVKRTIEKDRHTFTLNGVTLDIDRWPKLPVYVELEGQSVAALERVAAQLGLDWTKRFDGDAREVFRHYGYDMDKLTVITSNEFR